MFASKDLFFTKPSGGYQISRSVRLRSSATAYFSRTPATTTNRQTWTWSAWVKRGTLGTQQDIFDSSNGGGTVRCFLSFITSNALYFQFDAATASITTTSVYRDTSAWYHIILAVDSTQATASNRLKLYVNGSQITAGTFNYPSLNANSELNIGTQPFNIGRYSNAGEYVDGYLTEINFVDGQQLTPSSFGQTNAVTGVWQPIKYGGTYGTNGFYLNFSDNSNNTATTIGKDYSGNGNNWTPNNISVTAGVTYDSMVDSPTVGATSSNYAVLNPLTPVKSTLVDGNIRTTGGDRYSISTIGITSGKWYAEMTVTTVGTESSIGIATTIDSVGSLVGNNASSWGYVNSGNKYTNTTNTAYGASYTTGDVIGMAFDADAGTLTFYKNNASQGTAFTGLTSGPYFFAMSGRTSGTANNCTLNFGQQGFVYTPPTGFVALNTQNLPTPTISNGANYMAATLYTGNGTVTGNTQSISNAVNGISFQPDLVWIKSRSAASWNVLTDSVRGANKTIYSNDTFQEESLTNVMNSFNSGGFTAAYNSSYTSVITNANAATYVAWQWKASGTTSSNTSGSITSTVSAGATQGFSVVTFTAQSSGTGTVGHGLGVAPSMIITKQRATAGTAWTTYHSSVGNTAYLVLNTTAASATLSTVWNNTSPTSSVFSLGSAFAGASTMVAYCFSEVAGYSKFGSYTGNGSTDGTFVYLGFRARFLLIKCSSSIGGWVMLDTSRDTYNIVGNYLYANSSAADASSSNVLDIDSNGFKIRNTWTDINGNGTTYIYMAFAENPFKYSLAR